MPPTRQSAKQTQQPSILSGTGRQQFNFPDNCHLVITTPRQIFAWDKTGIHSLFRSRRSSIVAAREAKDGSGVLAIASRNVVVLHDTKRGKDESWGLNADQEEVRHLEYAPDAKSLFLTTTSDGTIQQYDTESARMMDPTEKLATPPVAMAVSPTGHIVLSASNDPPVVHVKNVAHNNVSSTLHPNASSAPISCAVFHPERPNIFLLAFRDGTVAAYDATKMPKRGPDQSSAKDGEISRISNLHRVVVTGDASLGKSTLAAPIAGAAFLPGYKTRAVTAGRDGKCKIIDFANKGVIVRSWHVKAPLTSISVFPVKTDGGRSARGSQRSQASSAHTIGGPKTTDSLIALSRVDGKVHIYDTVGLLLAQKAVSAQEEKIVSIEWAKGDKPQTIDLGGVGRHFSDAASTILRPIGSKASPRPRQGPITAARSQPVAVSPKTTYAKRELPSSPATLSAPTRKFTTHPDEVEEEDFSTVRHIPSPKRQPPAIPAVAAYDDLFSPVKPFTNPVEQSPQKHVLSPGRNRPRLSSQTFVKSPQAQLVAPKVSPGVSRRDKARLSTIESHATSSSSAAKRKERRSAKPLTSARHTSMDVSPGSVRRLSIAPPALRIGDGTASRSSTIAPLSNFNSKVLADLRKLNGNKAASQHGHGTLSAYSGTQQSSLLVSAENQPHKGHLRTRRPSVHLSNSDTWPTDSAASSFIVADDDIWLTSDAEDSTNQRRKRRAERMSRPPDRQKTRSNAVYVGMKGNTAAAHVGFDAQHIDGTTEEEMFSAETHMSPAGRFSPASENLRVLFPRSSSLSPQRRSREANPQLVASPKRRGLGLTAVALNEALGRNPKSPWARAKAGRRVPSPRKTLQVARKPQSGNMVRAKQVGTSDALVRSPGYQCLVCPETTARVQALEGEVAMMKGEILAMKALLRRNDLPFPACLR